MLLPRSKRLTVDCAAEYRRIVDQEELHMLHSNERNEHPHAKAHARGKDAIDSSMRGAANYSNQIVQGAQAVQEETRVSTDDESRVRT